MNHHLPTMAHGQPPMPPPRRQQDFPYNSGPPNMRTPPYVGYPPPHMNGMNGHIPPGYTAQQYPPAGPWYPPPNSYGPMNMPPRQFQPQYGPMIVSSYPHSQPMMAPNHMPPATLPIQPRESTPLQSTMSPSMSVHSIQPDVQELPVLPIPAHQHYPVASPPPRWEAKIVRESKPAFVAPVSSLRTLINPLISNDTDRRYRFLGSRCLNRLSLTEPPFGVEKVERCPLLCNFPRRTGGG